MSSVRHGAVASATALRTALTQQKGGDVPKSTLTTAKRLTAVELRALYGGKTREEALANHARKIQAQMEASNAIQQVLRERGAKIFTLVEDHQEEVVS